MLYPALDYGLGVLSTRCRVNSYTRAWHECHLMTIDIPADDEGRFPVRTLDLNHLSVAFGVADVQPVDSDAVADCCSHGAPSSRLVGDLDS